MAVRPKISGNQALSSLQNILSQLSSPIQLVSKEALTDLIYNGSEDVVVCLRKISLIGELEEMKSLFQTHIQGPDAAQVIDFVDLGEIQGPAKSFQENLLGFFRRGRSGITVYPQIMIVRLADPSEVPMKTVLELSDRRAIYNLRSLVTKSGLLYSAFIHSATYGWIRCQDSVRDLSGPTEEDRVILSFYEFQEEELLPAPATPKESRPDPVLEASTMSPPPISPALSTPKPTETRVTTTATQASSPVVATSPLSSSSASNLASSTLSFDLDATATAMERVGDAEAGLLISEDLGASMLVLLLEEDPQPLDRSMISSVSALASSTSLEQFSVQVAQLNELWLLCKDNGIDEQTAHSCLQPNIAPILSAIVTLEPKPAIEELKKQITLIVQLVQLVEKSNLTAEEQQRFYIEMRNPSSVVRPQIVKIFITLSTKPNIFERTLKRALAQK